jgi:hypothetical protein
MVLTLVIYTDITGRVKEAHAKMRVHAKQTPVVVKDTPVDPDERFCTCKEAAAILKMSEISIRRFLTQKRLTRLKCGARTLLRLSEVLAMVREA